jgi:hypothetical protein
MEIVLPSGHGTVTVPAAMFGSTEPFCQPQPGQSPPPSRLPSITYGFFVPATNLVHTEPPAPPARLKADITLVEPLTWGVTFHYAVTLTNISGSPYQFGPCPSYREMLKPVVAVRYYLNCGPAATIDPGNSVTFAMQIEPGSRSIAGEHVVFLIWSVDTGADRYGASAEVPNSTKTATPPSTKSTK